jgi:hypothetical protein
MIFSGFSEKLKPGEFQMRKCGHTRFWHDEGKYLMMTTQRGEGNKDFDYCQCIEFNLSTSIAAKLAKELEEKEVRYKRLMKILLMKMGQYNSFCYYC